MLVSGAFTQVFAAFAQGVFNRQLSRIVRDITDRTPLPDVDPNKASAARVLALPGLVRVAVSDFRDAFTMSLFPKTDAEARIVDAQLDALRDHTRLIPYAIPMAAIAGAASVYKWVGIGTLITWMALLVIAAVAHEFCARHFDRHRPTTIAATQNRALVMATVCTIYLLIWTSFGIWAWSPGILVSHYLVAFVLGCTLAAACTMGSVHVASVVGVAVPAGVLMIIRPVVADVFDPMTGISVVYVLLMAAFARSAHVTTSRALRLELDRADLIDSLRRAHSESDNARKRAEAASRAKSEFLANMNHELRTPLNAIIGFSDIIRTRAVGPASDKYAEYAGFINEAGSHLLGLISGVLELAKIEAGRKALNEQDIDVALAISDAIMDVQPAARDREVVVKTAHAASLPHITADPSALREILFHVLSNAVKFTAPTGDVTVGAHATPEGELAIAVSDTGIGISKEMQAQMFDRFGRGKHDVARANAGAGLGLPIVKGLVELHGGRVELASDVGVGTTVTVFFPPERVMRAAQLAATG